MHGEQRRVAEDRAEPAVEARLGGAPDAACRPAGRCGVAEPRSATSTRLVTTAPVPGRAHDVGLDRPLLAVEGAGGGGGPIEVAGRGLVHGLGEQHVGDRVVRAGDLPQDGLEPGPALSGHLQLRQQPNHGCVGSIASSRSAVDHVARGDRLDRLVEVVGAGLQRRRDPQRHDQVGEAGVAQPAFDAVAEQRGERLAGGDALEQRSASRTRAELQVEVEGVRRSRWACRPLRSTAAATACASDGAAM